MSSREKKLLFFLLFAGFIILNAIGFSLYSAKKSQIDRELSAVKIKEQQTEILIAGASELKNEMEWLVQNEPKPSAYQIIQTQLRLFATDQAKKERLTIVSQDLLPTETSGLHYHRAEFKIKLTGKEASLYRWFYAINDPKKFRTAHHIRISPNSKNDTLIDCTATVAQWFPPLEPES